MLVDSSPQSFVDDPAFGMELDELDRGLIDREPPAPAPAPPDNDQPEPTRLLRRLREMSPAPQPVSVSEPIAAAVPVPDSVPDTLLDSVPDSIFAGQPREEAVSDRQPESLPTDPAFFEQLGTTLDELDHLASRSRGASVADELGIPEIVPPAPDDADFADEDDRDQIETSTFGTIMTRTAHVAMFIACMGIGGLAAAFVFHDRLAQIQLF